MHIIDEKKDTLKNTSYDDNNKEYMVDSQLSVCSFDKVKEWYIQNKIPNVNPNPKSNDALYFRDQDCYFIEFKNGKIDRKVTFNLKKKIYDSLFLLFDLKYVDKNGVCIDSISYTRKHMTYILVYNEAKSSSKYPQKQIDDTKDTLVENTHISTNRTNLYKQLRALAKEELISFDLEQFKNYFFKNVHTYTVEEFQKNFLTHWEKDMN